MAQLPDSDASASVKSKARHGNGGNDAGAWRSNGEPISRGLSKMEICFKGRTGAKAQVQT